MKKKLIIFALYLLIVSCSKTEGHEKKSVSGSTSEVNLNQKFQLEQGQSVMVKVKKIKITLEKLEKPFGDEARFAGIVSLKAEMTDGQTKQFQFQLENTPDYEFNIDHTKINFLGYSNEKISLSVS